MTVKEIEALKVAADEVLIIRVQIADADENADFVPDLVAHLAEIGLAERSVVIVAGDGDIEFAVAKK